MRTIEELISIYGPATCPWCGLYSRVFVRAGSELVCTECSREAQAIDATWDWNAQYEGESDGNRPN